MFWVVLGIALTNTMLFIIHPGASVLVAIFTYCSSDSVSLATLHITVVLASEISKFSLMYFNLLFPLGDLALPLVLL